ncbi:polysaccharide biosynthesis/export family protein [Dokdonia sp. Hel_I_53]|uniref:polysaccharide biosynthesis/export family protein n=1 Tax=Dokdonia sp. Hel_I_53 TaxID=1566287 RepID=UPI00119AFC12|nr:polysaccharide biosynthesis/export family protein [Dokdonia sp. Hel_I_53]TVZ51355.1 polysaccharide export outer membrane protein [Dokdonia sp. Hel_I_53]
MYLRFSYNYLLVVILSFLFSSCISKKEVLYFQDIERLESQSQNFNYNTIIRPNDLLSITVSSQDPESVAIFNPVAGASGALRTTNERLGTYLVDRNGNIEFPYLGTINIGNKTRIEAVSKLREGISQFAKEAVINLRILNFTVSVLGEVQRPGTFTVPDERITVLEALGLAGDMTIFGERKTVKVIREENGIKTYGELDFTSIDVVNSPFYYLQQNDVIVVSPNNAQVQSGAFNRNSTIFISIAGIIISVLTIVTR